MERKKTTAAADARDILLKLAAGETVRGVTAPPMRIPGKLTLLGSSYKVDKGAAAGIETAILYLAPADSGGIRRNGKPLNLCPWASPGCRRGCLGENAGRMVQSGVANSRTWKTALFAAAPELMREMLEVEIVALQRRAARKGAVPALRLDGTSDIGLALLWDIPRRFPAVQVYDYTKSAARLRKASQLGLSNYHLTFSASENADSLDGARTALNLGYSVAAIVPADTVPDAGRLSRRVAGRHAAVISGDDTDARFTDAPGSIVYLGVKGGRAVAEKLGEMVFAV
jgi:hypothetical protein